MNDDINDVNFNIKLLLNFNYAVLHPDARERIAYILQKQQREIFELKQTIEAAKNGSKNISYQILSLCEALESMLRDCPPSDKQPFLYNNLDAIKKAKNALSFAKEGK